MATTPVTDEYINGIIISTGAFNPNLNKTQGVKLRELVKTLRDNLEAQISEAAESGPTGPKGPKGDTGDTGPQGQAGNPGSNGVGVVAGGSAGQVLTKIDNADYNTKWSTPSSAGGSPGGANNQLQYNNAGAFGGSSKFTFDTTVLNLNNASMYLGTGSVHPSAILQTDSVIKGVLIPRMTEAQRLAIVSPAIGLQVYQTDAGAYGEGCYQYRSTGWTASSGGVAGVSNQIQFNNGGSFAGNPNLTIDPAGNFYTKGPTQSFDSSGTTVVLFRSAGNIFAYMGSGSNFGATYATAATDFYIGTTGKLEIAGNLYLSGIVHLPASGTLGGAATNIVYGTGSNFYWAWNYGSTGQYQMGFSNAGNALNSPQNPSDFLLVGQQNFGICDNGGSSQATVYAQFMRNTKSFILNGGQATGFTADPNAIFQMDTTTKGFLPPRMTTTQKNAIVSPSEGLVLYDTDLHKLCIRTASNWEMLSSS